MICEQCEGVILPTHAHYVEITALIKAQGSSLARKHKTGRYYCRSCVETRKEIDGQLTLPTVTPPRQDGEA